jgi:lysophospholipase L1-like esterase
VRALIAIALAALLLSGCSEEALAQARPRGAGGLRQRKVVAWIGDSITLGVTAVDAFRPPQRLEVLLGTSNYVVTNFGVSGYTAAQIRSVWTDKVRGHGYTVLIHEGGVNDLIAGTAGATVSTTIQTTLAEARADGMRVVLLTVLPWGAYASSSAPKQVETLALNASLTAWCTANASTCVDTYTAMGEPGTPANLATAYDLSDHLHPNETTGNAALAAAVKGAFP